MKQNMKTALCVFASSFSLTFAVLATPPMADAQDGLRKPQASTNALLAAVPVALQARPGTPADRTARQLVAQDLAEANQAGEKPLVLVASAALGKARDSAALFVQLQSARECGSAGCNTLSFQRVHGQWRQILDTVGGPVRVAASSHGGMHDLIVRGSGRLIWNGVHYVDRAI